MSRKDYQALADLIRTECQNEKERERFIKIACDFFKADNGRFDRERFTSACRPKQTA